MGLLKKIFKPVSKVLDKIIPNEIKPALPYLAAFAPYMAPGIFGAGASRIGSFLKAGQYANQIGGGILGAGLNVGAQLAQEGNEGDVNLLSAGLGALQGAMAVPGSADTFAGGRIVGTGADGKAITASEYAKLSKGANLGTGVIETGGMTADLVPAVTSAPIKGPIPFNQVVQGGSSGLTGLAKAKNLALTGLEKGSKFISKGMAGDFVDKAKVLSIPAATATGDLMQAEARQLEKQAAIDAALAEAEALADAGLRGDAIRNAMRAYGFFSDDEIENTVASAGYRAGGRVGFEIGGLGRLMQGRKGEETEENFLTIDGGEGIKLFMLDDIDKPIIKKSYSKEDSGRRNEAFFEIINPETGAISTISQTDYFAQYGEPRAKGGRVGYRFGGIDAAIENIEDQDIKESAKMVADMPDMDLMELIEEFEIIFKRKPMNMDELKQFYRENYEMESPVRLKEKIKEKVTVEAKDGGLMDLGGKEMDLRGGGFVPIGKKERADDVPARLSKNEFVMTADAVRGAGGGDINKGAKRMYETMNNLEARA